MARERIHDGIKYLVDDSGELKRLEDSMNVFFENYDFSPKISLIVSPGVLIKPADYNHITKICSYSNAKGQLDFFSNDSDGDSEIIIRIGYNRYFIKLNPDKE